MSFGRASKKLRTSPAHPFAIGQQIGARPNGTQHALSSAVNWMRQVVGSRSGDLSKEEIPIPQIMTMTTTIVLIIV